MSQFDKMFSLTPMTKEEMAKHIQANREWLEGKRCTLCGSRMEEWIGTMLPICDDCLKKEGLTMPDFPKYFELNNKLWIRQDLLPKSDCYTLIFRSIFGAHIPFTKQISMEFTKMRFVNGDQIEYYWRYDGWKGVEANHARVIKAIEYLTENEYMTPSGLRITKGENVD